VLPVAGRGEHRDLQAGFARADRRWPSVLASRTPNTDTPGRPRARCERVLTIGWARTTEGSPQRATYTRPRPAVIIHAVHDPGDGFSPELQNEFAAAREFGRRRTRLRMWASGILLMVFAPIGCAIAFSRDHYIQPTPRSGPPEVGIAILVAVGLADLIVRWRKRKMIERVAAEFGIDPASLDPAAVDVTM
jgi:hypothetical protein